MKLYKINIKYNSASICVQAKDGENLLDVLNRCGIALPAACGGRGTCGKCRVHLEAGEVYGTRPDADGMILACRSTVCGSLTLTVPVNRGHGLTLHDGALNSSSAFTAVPFHRYGIALDVGTTTIAVALCDLDDGLTIGTASSLNPQSGFGADVISRIQAASEGHLVQMRQILFRQINEMISDLRNRFNLPNEPLYRMTVCGNTTMMHIFAGIDPTPLGQYPFTPVFTDLRRLSGKSEGLDAKEILLLPGVAAYIGSDIICGIHATGLTSQRETAFLADIGTNGEMVLWYCGQLYCTSAAAGPALEGADISCGVGGIPGAVNHVYSKNGTAELHIETIDNLPPIGICGCGLVDLVALLLERGIVDETGAMLKPGKLTDPLRGRLSDNGFCLTEPGTHPVLYLTDADIRQYQLAKGALNTAAVILAESAGISPSQIARVYIAGSLGTYLNHEPMLRTGILPSCFKDKMKAMGNTALQGAQKALLFPETVKELGRLASLCKIIDLNSHPKFMKLFMDSMLF